MNGRPLSILLVEDNIGHAELVMRSFQDHHVGNKIHHVTDGEAALDYLNRRGDYVNPEMSPRPHVILLDLRLPRIDGLEVLKEIKTNEKLKTIPVVVLTTSSAESDLAMAYEYNANSYVVKPLNFDKFNHLMETLGFYWLAWNRKPWETN